MEDVKAPSTTGSQQHSVEIFATPKAYELIMDPESLIARMVIERAQSYSFGEEVKSDYVIFMRAREIALHCRRAESPSDKHAIIIAERGRIAAEFDELLKECSPISFV